MLRAEGANDSACTHRPHAWRGRATGKTPRSDRRDRSHGGLPGGPARGTGETDRASALSQCVRQDIAHVVALEAALSMAGCAGTRKAAAPCFWTAAPHVGHRLAHNRGRVDLR